MADEELFKQITDRMLDLYQKKNADYGGSVSSTYKTFGLTAFLVRMQDKINRCVSLERNGRDRAVSDERIEDTLIDLANYAVLALIETEKEKALTKAKA